MASAGTVTIDVDARTAKFEEGMSRASRTAQRESQKIQAQAVAVGSAVGTMLGNVASAVTSSIARMTINAIRSANDIGEFGSKVGVSVETLSALRREAGLAGTNFDQLKRGIVQMSSAASTNNVAFKAMGINTKDANGHLKTSEQLLADVAAKFAGYQDGAAKTALAQRVFGRSGAELIPVLNQLGEQGLAGVIEKTREAGALMSGDGVNGAKQFTDTVNELRTQTDDFGQNLAQQLLPALNEAASLFKDQEFQQSIRNIAEDIGALAKAAVDAAGGLAKLYSRREGAKAFQYDGVVLNQGGLEAANERLRTLQAKKAGTGRLDIGTGSFNEFYEGIRSKFVGGGEDLDAEIAKTKAAIANGWKPGLTDAQVTANRAFGDQVSSGAALTVVAGKKAAPVLSDFKPNTLAKQADAAQQRLAAQIEALQSRVEGPATAAWNTYAKAVRDAAADGAKMIQGGKDVTQVQEQVQLAVEAAGAAWQKYQSDAEKAFNNEMADVTAAIGGQTKEMDQIAQATRSYDRAIESLSDRLANGTINQQQFSRGTAEYKALLDKQVEDIKNANDEVNQFALQAARSIQSNIADTFYDMYKGVKGGLDGILKSWGDMILKMLAQAQAAQLAKALFGDYGNTGQLGGIVGSVVQGWMGGSGGSGYTGAGYLGGNGTGGYGMQLQSVPGRATGGPTSRGQIYEVAEGGRPELYHTDGRTYLLSGSDGQVTPARSNRAAASVGASGGGIELHVHNNVGAQVTQKSSTGSNGMPRLDVFIDQIDQALADRVNSGKSRTGRAIAARSGTNMAANI